MYLKNSKFIFFIVLSSLFILTEGCSSRFFGYGLDNSVQPPSTNLNPLDEDYTFKFELMRIQNRMMSVSLHTIVDFIINSGALEFSCPKSSNDSLNNLNQTDAKAFPDILDCHKYYLCGRDGHVQKECEPDQGFDKESSKCISNTLVPLCKAVEKRSDYKCKTTGLKVHDESCGMFILCTKDMMAYAASCNLGDFFDRSLLICLPSNEAEC